MSLIIFFGMALFVFTGGVIVIGVTLHHWYQQARARRLAKGESK